MSAQRPSSWHGKEAPHSFFSLDISNPRFANILEIAFEKIKATSSDHFAFKRLWIEDVREPWPNGTALAWHARGAGFESPRNQNFVLVPSVLSLPLV